MGMLLTWWLSSVLRSCDWWLMCTDVWAEIETMTSSRDDEPRWWAALMSRKDEQRFMSSSEQWYNRVDVMSREDEQLWCVRDFLMVTQVYYIVNASVSCFLRLGYLKPFLAGSKKTRKGPGCRAGALYISRCWFCLMVVAGPKIIQKDYKIILCCVLLCYGF